MPDGFCRSRSAIKKGPRSLISEIPDKVLLASGSMTAAVDRLEMCRCR